MAGLLKNLLVLVVGMQACTPAWLVAQESPEYPSPEPEVSVVVTRLGSELYRYSYRVRMPPPSIEHPPARLLAFSLTTTSGQQSMTAPEGWKSEDVNRTKVVWRNDIVPARRDSAYGWFAIERKGLPSLIEVSVEMQGASVSAPVKSTRVWSVGPADIPSDFHLLDFMDSFLVTFQRIQQLGWVDPNHSYVPNATFRIERAIGQLEKGDSVMALVEFESASRTLNSDDFRRMSREASAVLIHNFRHAITRGLQPGTVTGIIVDAQTGETIQNAVAVVSGRGGGIVGGAYSVRVPAGTYEIRAGDLWYETVTDTVTVRPDTTARVDFALSRHRQRGPQLPTGLKFAIPGGRDSTQMAVEDYGRAALDAFAVFLSVERSKAVGHEYFIDLDGDGNVDAVGLFGGRERFETGYLGVCLFGKHCTGAPVGASTQTVAEQDRSLWAEHSQWAEGRIVGVDPETYQITYPPRGGWEDCTLRSGYSRREPTIMCRSKGRWYSVDADTLRMGCCLN